MKLTQLKEASYYRQRSPKEVYDKLEDLMRIPSHDNLQIFDVEIDRHKNVYANIRVWTDSEQGVLDSVEKFAEKNNLPYDGVTDIDTMGRTQPVDWRAVIVFGEWYE